MFWCTSAIVIFPTCRLTFPESNFPKYASLPCHIFLLLALTTCTLLIVFLLFTRDQHMQKSSTNLRNTQLTTSATIRFLAIYIPPQEMSWSLFFQIHLCYLSQEMQCKFYMEGRSKSDSTIIHTLLMPFLSQSIFGKTII